MCVVLFFILHFKEKNYYKTTILQYLLNTDTSSIYYTNKAECNLKLISKRTPFLN